jgi:hypothetical protein
MAHPEKIKIRDIPPTGVRLSPELRAGLLREAAINNRTLHGEIVLRLVNSLEGGQTLPDSYATRATATVLHTTTGPTHHSTSAQEKSPVDSLSEIDRAMLGVFRRLPPEKQLALLSLFR